VAFPKNRFRRPLLNWYRENARNLPWRKTRNPYAILISEFMLQQTQVATVLSYYNKWLRRFPDFATLAHASEADVLHAWQGLGYYARARNLRATAGIVVNRHGGHFPHKIARMRELPGIGRYTANAVATFAFNQSVPIVEANTARVLTRLFNFQKPIDCTAGREALWKRAAMLVPKSSAGTYNSALIDLGALVCLPRQPKCEICPVKKFCRARNPETLPIKKARLPTRQLVETHALIVKESKVLLAQSRARWRGMWILPPLQTRSTTKRAVHMSIFPFTHHRITLAVYRHRAPPKIFSNQKWFEISALKNIAMPSPHRRATRHLLTAGRAARSRRQRSSEL
jgi:A/G-specific adenine glycosylase